MWGRCPALLAGALAAGVIAAPASFAAAPAQTACWQQVLDAWSDGKLGPNYPIRCYVSALNNLPADIQGYSSAANDIRRALLAAIRDSPARSTASVHHSTVSPERTRSLLGTGAQPRSGHRRLPPHPLLILAGCGIAIAAVCAVAVRRGTRARPPQRRLP